VNYKVEENGVWNGMYTLSTSFGVSSLSPNTTITFQIVAVDPSNNWSAGPSATFSTAPAQCQGYAECLTNLFTNTPTTTQGGLLTVNDTMTNEGQDSIGITSMTFSGESKLFTINSVTELLLRVGETGTRGLLIGVPQDVNIGTHAITIMVWWQYNSTSSGWVLGGEVSQNRTFTVTSKAPAPLTLPGLTSLVRALTDYGYLFVGGGLAILSFVVVLVIRNDRRRRAGLLQPSSPEKLASQPTQ
jgi:hypothetical protein